MSKENKDDLNDRKYPQMTEIPQFLTLLRFVKQSYLFTFPDSSYRCDKKKYPNFENCEKVFEKLRISEAK
jgi:hypothetical protein